MTGEDTIRAGFVFKIFKKCDVTNRNTPHEQK